MVQRKRTRTESGKKAVLATILTGKGEKAINDQVVKRERDRPICALQREKKEDLPLTPTPSHRKLLTEAEAAELLTVLSRSAAGRCSIGGARRIRQPPESICGGKAANKRPAKKAAAAAGEEESEDCEGEE